MREVNKVNREVNKVDREVNREVTFFYANLQENYVFIRLKESHRFPKFFTV